MPERDESRPSATPWSPAEPGEPEPDWADEIRRRRRARGDRLREIFETFDDDDPTSTVPARTPAERRGDERRDAPALPPGRERDR
jgi:hypothetical protein